MSSTTTGPTCEILVRIPMADGSVGEGLMVSAEGGLITALFNAESEPPMAVGREGIMSIVGGDKAAQVRYRIVKREDAGNEITYTFQSDITHGGRWGFVNNRRSAFRVVPGSPVSVSIASGGFTAQGQLLDLSSIGAAVRLRIADEHALCRVRRMLLLVTLPPEDEALVIPSIAMNRHAEGRFIRYGLSFDLDESSNRDAIEDALRAYIQQRQVEMIQALRDMIDQA